MTEPSDLADDRSLRHDPTVSEDEKPDTLSVTDALLYAPLGLLLELPGQLPKWVERGRNQVGVARMIGTFALNNAPAGSDKVSSSLRRGFGLDVAEGVELAGVPERPQGVDDPVPPTEDAGPAPDVTSLAIPEYESLAASHVLPRLVGLDASELADVAAFERANRHRRTVLNRIEALMDAAD